MKKLIFSLLAALTIFSFGFICGCGGEAQVMYTLSEDGTYYIVSGVSGNKSALTSYEVPATYAPDESAQPLPVKEIGDSAFYQCYNLSNITLPTGITKIGSLAFAKSTMSAFTIPETVTEIGMSAFALCSNLTEIVVPESVVTMGDSIFTGCTALKKAVIKANIRDLVCDTFYNSVEIYATEVSYYTNLTEIYLPASLEKIHYYALSGNFLQHIYFAGSEEQWNKIYFYTRNKKDNGELEEVKYKGEKANVLGTAVQVHFNVQF